jgi:hypothetical protein
MMESWDGVNTVLMRYIGFGMNAMKRLLRFLIALPIVSFLSATGGVSFAAVQVASQKSSTDKTLSSVGFLDFKSLLFSSGAGDDLDGVSNQIRIIGPEMFERAAIRHGMLRKFKEKPSTVFSTNPIWQWNDSDLEGLDVEVYGKPSAASTELIDAIIGDLTDNAGSHGVSWMMNPAVGPSTTAYFHSATQKVMSLIEELENAATAAPAISQTAHGPQPTVKISHLLLVFFFGLVLVTIGLLQRRFRKSPPWTPKTADPLACFDTIRNSPIRYSPKTP